MTEYSTAELGRLSNARLREIAQSDLENHDLLLRIHEVLVPRTRQRAIDLRQWIEATTGHLPSTVTPVNSSLPWYKRRTSQFFIVVLGTVAVGFGHGAGEEMWQQTRQFVTNLLD